MGSLGMPEILIILIIALIVFGPRKLPELGKTLGKSLAQFRRASEDFKRQWEDEVTMERQRIEAPAPYEQPSYSEPDQPRADEVATSAPSEPSTTETASEAAEAPTETASEAAEAPTETASEAAVAAQPEESAAQETKRDWM